MASKRVIAYFMHESEERAALDLMPNAQRTDSFVFGEVDDDKIEALKAGGLLVEELAAEAPSPLETLSEKFTTFSRRAASEAPAPTFDTTRPNTCTIALAGPLLPTWREELADRGVVLNEAIGRQRYRADLSLAQMAAVRTLSFVTSCTVHSPLHSAPPIPTVPASPPVGRPFAPIVTYDIRLRDAGDAPAVTARLTGRDDVLLVGVQGRKMRVAVPEGSALLAELRALVEVKDIFEYVPPELFNDRARILLGIDGTSTPSPAPFPFDGTGQIVGVADTGIDDVHPDLKARLITAIALGRPGDASDPNGHGTHVAGSILGDGSASGGAVRGMAPAARLVFQSVLDAQGKLGGLPWDLNDLFDEAYKAGARIHNNSWGASTASRYAFNSLEADEFVDAHRDMALVIAAGNEGTAAAPFSSKKGYVDWLSIGSPATAKNAITVGASRTDRATGGYAAFTWGAQWPSDYPDSPIFGELISGDPECMAAFSSRGPCDDNRIKPDVVAPGTDIVSAKSSRAPLRNFWGSYPGHSNHYAYMGGTSMAAPIVSGCLALIRQYYVDQRTHEPSAALLKATLVNSTRRLTGGDSTADHADLPNFHQGFGCVYMPLAVPNAAEPGLVLEFLDTWKDAGLKLAYTGARLRFYIAVGGGRPLRLCLAYIDTPARALQNNLNLFVQAPDGTKWTGNQGLPRRITPVDKDNNVEIVRIETPTPGDYLIQISAENMLGAQAQDFALVVTGDLTGSFIQT